DMLVAMNDWDYLIDEFSELVIWDKIDDLFGEEFGDEMDYLKEMKKIAMAGGQAVIAIDQRDDSSQDVFVAFEFDNSVALKGLVENFVEDVYGSDAVVMARGNVLHYSAAYDDFYMTKYGNIFFLTNSQSAREAALERLIAGKGLAGNKQFVSRAGDISEKALFVYVNGDMQDYSMGFGAQTLAGFEETYVSYEGSSSKIVGESKVYVDDDSSFRDMYVQSSVDLADKVPGKDIILYAEFADGKAFVDLMMDTLGEMFSGENLYVGIADQLEISAPVLTGMFDGQMALVVSDSGMMIPAMGFYAEVDEGNDNAAFVNAIESKLNLLVAGVSDGYLKTDKVMIGGDEVNKLYLDWEFVPDSFWENFGKDSAMIKEDLEGEVLELYYGVIGDLFVFAFYPNFDEDFGLVEAIGDSKLEGAIDKLKDGKYEGSFSYFSTNGLMDIADRYVGILDKAVDVGDISEGIEWYDAIKQAILKVDYGYSYAELRDDYIFQKEYVYLK
ncbi:hypothetical protein KJ632_04415, partial [Patescibacteria group bacterium]|nr:hypothetical protein [Patescibacteria group bacterium]